MANPGMANNAPARMQQCAVGERVPPTSRTVMPAEAGMQYSEAAKAKSRRPRITGSSALADDGI
jgi:hypothetical protein